MGLRNGLAQRINHHNLICQTSAPEVMILWLSTWHSLWVTPWPKRSIFYGFHGWGSVIIFQNLQRRDTNKHHGNFAKANFYLQEEWWSFHKFSCHKALLQRTSDSSAEPTANFGGGGLSFTNYEPTVHIGHNRRDLSPPTLPNQRIEKSWAWAGKRWWVGVGTLTEATSSVMQILENKSCLRIWLGCNICNIFLSTEDTTHSAPISTTPSASVSQPRFENLPNMAAISPHPSIQNSTES